MRGKQVRVFEPFEKNARKRYPYKSMYEITKELNKMFEEVYHGRKKR